MTDQPIYTKEEALSRETFLALMWALSYPGRVEALPESDGDTLFIIGETLLDLETSYYTPDAALAEQLARTGARALEPERAAYHFYPALEALDTVEAASVGTMLYPDQAATLVIACTLNSGRPFELSGPGIQGTTTVQMGGLPVEFWQLREHAIHYPLGWDVFLVDGRQVLGLPRTTMIRQE